MSTPAGLLRRTSRTRIGVFAGSTVALATALVLTACAASPSADSPSSTASAGLTGDVTAAVDTSAVIEQLAWGAAQTVNGVTYDATATSATLTDGTVTIASNGIPNHERDEYYAVGTAGVQLPNASNSQLVTDPTSEQDQSFSIPTRPEYSDTTTAAPLGSIGIMISGAVIFNPYEADNTTVAMSSNFTLNQDGKTGSFIDQCAGHPGPGGEYHYHGNSECVTRQVDETGGGSHIIGLALDGYPIYGAYDIDGVEVTASELDECNGIFSATPEFPSGIYHYVLPLTTDETSSIRCFHGVVDESQIQPMPPMQGGPGNGPGQGPGQGQPPGQGAGMQPGMPPAPRPGG